MQVQPAVGFCEDENCNAIKRVMESSIQSIGVQKAGNSFESRVIFTACC